MTNHIHLLLETGEQEVWKFMKYLSGCYAIYYNHKYLYSGHLFEGRYKSCLVKDDTYFQALLKKVQEQASEDAGFVTDLYDSIRDYTVTNMGNDIFAKLLVASRNGIADTQTVPGKGTEGENFDEYQIDENKLSEMIISMFYEKMD